MGGQCWWGVIARRREACHSNRRHRVARSGSVQHSGIAVLRGYHLDLCCHGGWLGSREDVLRGRHGTAGHS